MFRGCVATRPRTRGPATSERSARQQPVAAWRVRQAWAMRFGGRVVTRRRQVVRGMVWMLSKLTTQSVGTPSAGVSASSDTTPRTVRVRAATTTEPLRAAGARLPSEPEGASLTLVGLNPKP